MARIAILLGDEFEDVEYTLPRERLDAAGHTCTVVGRERGQTLRGKRGEAEVHTDAAASEVDADDFDAVLIPGGHSPDHLRLDPDVVELTRAFMDAEKPAAVVCHGPQLLIQAERVRGRTLTSWPSVRMDLENAGARWVDREVVEDGALITSRNPGDLEAFSEAFLKRLAG